MVYKNLDRMPEANTAGPLWQWVRNLLARLDAPEWA